MSPLHNSNLIGRLAPRYRNCTSRPLTVSCFRTHLSKTGTIKGSLGMKPRYYENLFSISSTLRSESNRGGAMRSWLRRLDRTGRINRFIQAFRFGVMRNTAYSDSIAHFIGSLLNYDSPLKGRACKTESKSCVHIRRAY